MNVVHFTDSTTPAAMMRQMMQLRGQDETIFFAGQGKVPAAETYVIRQKPFGQKALVKNIVRELPEDAILHVWTANMLDLAADVAEASGAKLILSVDHLSHNVDSVEHLPWDIGRYRANITVPTQRAADELISLRTDPARVFVLPPLAEIESCSYGVRSKIRDELGYSDDDFVMVVPAEMRKDAGHKMASWAHGILRNIDSKYRLIFPGDGPYEKTVRSFAATTGYESEVTYTGTKYTPAQLIAASDICLSCAERDAGLCDLAEAMARGGAIIASATPDHLQVCEDGQNAVLAEAASPADLASKIMALAEDDQMRETIKVGAVETAKKLFAPNETRKILSDIYKACK